jgi:hypothetical protein
VQNKQIKAKILIFIFDYPFSFSIGDALKRAKTNKVRLTKE